MNIHQDDLADAEFANTGRLPPVRLRTINPDDVAQQTHDALLSRLSRLAMAIGVVEVPEPAHVPSEAWLAVHQLATYATTGVPPEGRHELIAEYQLSVSEYADWLGELTGLDEPRTPLQTVLAASIAREALAREDAVTTGQLAVLASLSRGRVAQLQASGDAPAGELDRGRHGQPRLVPAKAACAWLSGRGVEA